MGTLINFQYTLGQYYCVYNWDKCIGRKIIYICFVKLRESVGCVVPWLYDPQTSSLDICKPMLAKKASENFFNSVRSAKCMQPCCTLELDMVNRFSTKINTIEMKGGIVEIRFPPTVKFYREFKMYELVSLLAEVGGYLGLFLGVSLFDIRILFKFITDKDLKNSSSTLVEPFPD